MAQSSTITTSISTVTSLLVMVVVLRFGWPVILEPKAQQHFVERPLKASHAIAELVDLVEQIGKLFVRYGHSFLRRLFACSGNSLHHALFNALSRVCVQRPFFARFDSACP